MKITQSKAKNMLATIKVEVSESDYSESVDRVLKRYRKDAVVPGFRKGKTPMSIIEKQYKTSVIVDEVNKLLQDSLYKHITDNKLKVLGSPLPKEEKEIDWKNDTEFIFEYEIGLAPELDFKISNKDKLTYYNIKADNKLVDKYCNDIPFNPSALSLFKWAPIADELKKLDRKIVLNSMILKWDVVKKEFKERLQF